MAKYHLKTPILEEYARQLKVGDLVYISGDRVYTARDEAHQRALEFFQKGESIPVSLEGGVIYHAGPIVKQNDGTWEIVSIGPTTSIRMERFEDQFLRNSKVRIIIGKGGMGMKTLSALKEVGAVYCSYIGGCGALAARSIKEVRGREWGDLGMPEALWLLNVDNFGPLLVTMDSQGNSLYLKIEKEVQVNKSRIYKKLEIPLDP